MRIIACDADVAEGAAHLAALEPRFAKALRLTGPLPLRRRKDGFEELLAAIVSQQISVAAANGIWRRMKAAKLTGPRKVLWATEDDLRACGLSRQKVRYAKALAEARIDYPALREAPTEEVVATLTQVPGIGIWTAEIYAMFSLGHADVFAPGDLALQESARLLFDLPERPKERVLRQMAEEWSPWRAVAARVLWAYYHVAKQREGVRQTMSELTNHTRDSLSGRAGSAVIFLHGYGADGNDLLGLADPLSEHMPDTMFFAPDAPERCIGNPMGYQWFPIPWIDGSSEEEARAGMLRAVDELNDYLDTIMVDYGFEPDQIALLGFSQGTMMSLHVAPRREEAVSCVVGFSGRILEPEMLEDEMQVKMPVLLIHGDEDQVVPPQSLPEAGQALQAAGFETYAHIMRGTGHGISPDGLGVALAFLRKNLGYEEA